LRTGSGPALVLLHGIGSSAASWQEQLASLSARYDVIAWNAPGYGASSPLPDEAPDCGQYAERLLQLLDALTIGQCFLAGHSLGSLIAARFARLYPERIAALTLASCALGHARHEPAERQRLLESRLNDVRELGMRGMAEKRGPRLLTPNAGEALVRMVVNNMAQADPHGYAQASRMLSGGDMIADIAKFSPDLPVQVLCGADDIITPPAANERAAQARANIALTLIPAAGHLVYFEQPRAFNAALIAFNDRHAGAANRNGAAHG